MHLIICLWTEYAEADRIPVCMCWCVTIRTLGFLISVCRWSLLTFHENLAKYATGCCILCAVRLCLEDTCKKSADYWQQELVNLAAKKMVISLELDHLPSLVSTAPSTVGWCSQTTFLHHCFCSNGICNDWGLGVGLILSNFVHKSPYERA